MTRTASRSGSNIATFDLERGDLAAAAEHAATSLECSVRLSYREVTAYGLGIVAAVAAETGRPEDAGMLAGAFSEHFRAIGSDPQAVEAERLAATLARVSAETDVEAAVARGTGLTPDEVLELARVRVGPLDLDDLRLAVATERHAAAPVEPPRRLDYEHARLTDRLERLPLRRAERRLELADDLSLAQRSVPWNAMLIPVVPVTCSPCTRSGSPASSRRPLTQ